MYLNQTGQKSAIRALYNNLPMFCSLMLALLLSRARPPKPSLDFVFENASIYTFTKLYVSVHDVNSWQEGITYGFNLQRIGKVQYSYRHGEPWIQYWYR